MKKKLQIWALIQYISEIEHIIAYLNDNNKHKITRYKDKVMLILVKQELQESNYILFTPYINANS